MLTVDDVVKDFDAICNRVDHDGKPQPPFVPTITLNIVDLGWHQKEFALRRSFAYTVVAPDESRVLGCVYLNPSETHDVRVKLWVRNDAYADGLDTLLEAAVRRMGRYALAVRARELRRARPVSTSRTTRSATSAVMSAEPTPVGMHLDDVGRRQLDARGDLAHRPEKVDRVMPPGSGVPVPGANAGSSTSTSTVR